MSIFDQAHGYEGQAVIPILYEGRILSQAIRQIYDEADRKREELLKTVDPEVAKYAILSYKQLIKIISHPQVIIPPEIEMNM